MLPILFATTTTPPPAEIARFNHALDEATRSMRNAAVMALWEDEGVDLLPGQPALVGKKAIAKFLDDATAGMSGAKMVTFEFQCYDIRVDGRTATEWCTEHQVVRFAGLDITVYSSDAKRAPGHTVPAGLTGAAVGGL